MTDPTPDFSPEATGLSDDFRPNTNNTVLLRNLVREAKGWMVGPQTLSDSPGYYLDLIHRMDQAVDDEMEPLVPTDEAATMSEVPPKYCPWCGSEVAQWGHDDNCPRPESVSLSVGRV